MMNSEVDIPKVSQDIRWKQLQHCHESNHLQILRKLDCVFIGLILVFWCKAAVWVRDLLVLNDESSGMSQVVLASQVELFVK